MTSMQSVAVTRSRLALQIDQAQVLRLRLDGVYMLHMDLRGSDQLYLYVTCTSAVPTKIQRRVGQFERVVLAAELRGYHAERRCHAEKLSAADRPGMGSETTS